MSYVSERKKIKKKMQKRYPYQKLVWVNGRLCALLGSSEFEPLPEAAVCLKPRLQKTEESNQGSFIHRRSKSYYAREHAKAINKTRTSRSTYGW